MVNQKIFDIANQLQDVVKEQMGEAKKALQGLPEGETKKSLDSLLKQAATGKLSHDDAQKELSKIIKNAS